MEFKVGAVYQSHDPTISRRIIRIAADCIYYVYLKNGRPEHSDLGMTTEMFGKFTSHEIPPEQL